MPQSPDSSRNESLEGIKKGTRESQRLEGLLGPVRQQQPGDIHRNDRGEFTFVDGVLSENQILDRMAAILSDRTIEDFGEFLDYQRMNMLLRSVQVTGSLRHGQGDKSALERELIIANQCATQLEYLPEVIRQVLEFQSRYASLREFGCKFNLPLPADVRAQEQTSEAFMKVLNDTLAERLRLANVLNLREQIRLGEGLQSFRENVHRAEINPARTRDEETQLSRDRLNVNLAEKLGLDETHVADLKRDYGALTSKLSASDRALLQADRESALRTRLNEVNQKLIDVLAGKKEATGLAEDFIPQKMYIDCWKQFDSDLLVLQQELEKTAGKKNPQEVVAEQQYLRNIRASMSSDLTSFVNDLGQYQLTLDELARVQNHVGHTMSLSDATLPSSAVAPKDAAALTEWLADRVKYRGKALGNALDQAEKMLEPGAGEQLENLWNKQGEIIVTDSAVKLARIASGWMPSESNGSGVAEKVFREGASILGMPGSQEEGRDKLAGPVLEAMGWPKGRTWAELSDREKTEIRTRTKSVIDALQNFDRTTITNLRRTMIAIEEMHQKHPPSSFAGEPVSREVLDAMDGQRIDHDLTGERIGDQTVNRATAYILLLRQRRKDWGNPEGKSGFIGEYAKLIDSLDGNIKHHLDIGGALFNMQRAYFEYARGVLTVSGIGVFAPWVVWATWGTATVVVPVARRIIPPVYRNGRNMLGKGASLVRGLSDFLKARTDTTEALSRMRFLARERQLAQWMEGTRGGQWMSRLPSVRNAQLTRAGGNAVKYGVVAIIPAIAVYETCITQQKVESAQGNNGLQNAYRDDNGTTALETGGLLATVPLALGPQIVLAAPVMYAADYRRSRSAVIADWEHGSENWMREYNSDGLITRLRDTTTTNAVEAGGGGALKPRIYFPSLKDQVDATNSIEDAQAATRANIMEAYFRKNLLLPDQSSEAVKQKVIRWKMNYMMMATQGAYNDTFSYVYEQADLYAELMMRKEQMESAREPLLLSYWDSDENRQWIDLSKLGIGASSSSEITRLVAAYQVNLRPREEVFLYNTLGKLASENNGAERVRACRETAAAVRRMVVAKLSHSIYKTESLIGEVDWPGIDSLVTSGNTKSGNLVRAYIADLVESELGRLVPNLLQGSLTADDYKNVCDKCNTFLQKVNGAPDNPTKTMGLYDEAMQYFGGGASARYSPKISPLLGLIYETARTGETN